MYPSPAPRRAIRLFLGISRTPDGRLEGRIRVGGTGGTSGTGAWRLFSGTLELLKVLEEHA
jgi:hypothetical protein